MSTQAQQILDFALLQSAAESYLDGIPLNNQAELQKRLSWGNNDLRNDYVAAIAAQDSGVRQLNPIFRDFRTDFPVFTRVPAAVFKSTCGGTSR